MWRTATAMPNSLIWWKTYTRNDRVASRIKHEQHASRCARCALTSLMRVCAYTLSRSHHSGRHFQLFECIRMQTKSVQHQHLSCGNRTKSIWSSSCEWNKNHNVKNLLRSRTFIYITEISSFNTRSCNRNFWKKKREKIESICIISLTHELTLCSLFSSSSRSVCSHRIHSTQPSDAAHNLSYSRDNYYTFVRSFMDVCVPHSAAIDGAASAASGFHKNGLHCAVECCLSVLFCCCFHIFLWPFSVRNNFASEMESFTDETGRFIYYYCTIAASIRLENRRCYNTYK